jgi:ArsR family transcriptional regulator
MRASWEGLFLAAVLSLFPSPWETDLGEPRFVLLELPMNRLDRQPRHLHSAEGDPEQINVRLTSVLYFCKNRNMPAAAAKKTTQQVVRYADMFSAMGTEARLRIMQLLLSAHPEGLVVGEIQEDLEIPNSTLSHHLDKLRNEGLVEVRRESTFLRYTANTDALQELLQFLYAECCTRNKAVKPRDIVQICR